MSEVLALRVNEACTKKALDSKLKEIEAKYKAPENCDFLCVPKVKIEFWFELARQARTKDLALQEAQRGITKGVQPVIELVEKILNAQKTKSELKPDSFINPLVDAITLLCNASFRLSLVRRETMREFVNPSYRSLCSKKTPPGKWLFGDELPKQIKEIAEVNRMAKKLGPSQTSPGTRRGDRRNTSGRGSTFNQGSRPKSIFFRLKESQQHHSQQEGSQEQPTFLDSYKAALLPVEVGAYAGNLANFLLSWRSITSDPWVLEAVSGYHLEFCTKPVQTKLPNPPILSVADKEIIDEELHKLLHKGAIEQAPYCKDQFISNMFLVPKKTGDLRPVKNLKSLNEFVEKIHFQMENIDMVKNLIKPGNYLASINFKDAYISIPIWQPHRKYLRFFWNNQTFQFACLPFGYSLAARVFT